MEREITTEDVERIKTNGFSFSIGDAISTGWGLMSKELGQTIGAGLVFFCISVAISFVPLIGGIISNFLTPVMCAGFLIVAHQLNNNQTVEFGDYFGGFKTQFGQILLATFFLFLITMAALIPFIVVLFVFIGDVFITIMNNPESAADALLANIASLGSLFFLALLLSFIPGLIVSILFSMTLPFITIGKMDALPALTASRKLVSQQFFKFFGFMLLMGIINIIGMLLLVIGLLFTYPLHFFAQYVIFQKITGDLSKSDLDITDHLVD